MSRLPREPPNSELPDSRFNGLSQRDEYCKEEGSQGYQVCSVWYCSSSSWDEDFLSDDSSFGENEGDSSENEQELNYEKMAPKNSEQHLQ